MNNENIDKRYKVSVIIPVYNSEKYLNQCLGSLINQTITDMQIICVDDGSTDNSLKILEEYSKKHINLFILHREHMGASEARNEGFKFAQGEYVIFLDSDDVFEKDMMEELYSSACKFNADIAICEYDLEMEENKKNYTEKIFKSYMNKYSICPFKVSDLPLEGLTFWITSPWNKLCKREFIEKEGIAFQDLDSANDVYFSCVSMILAKKIIHTESFRPMVHYRKNVTGQISSRRTVNDEYAAFEKIYLDLHNSQAFQEAYKQYFVLAFSTITLNFWGMKYGEEGKKIYQFFSINGIKKIGLDQGRKIKELEPYHEILSCLKGLSYESQWYRNDKMMGMRLKKKGYTELCDLCSKSKVALWGVGTRGRELVELLNQNSIRLEAVIDSDEKKQGTIYGSYLIDTYQNVKDRIDIVVITGKVYFSSVCEIIEKNKKEGTKVLPLFMYVESELDLNTCVFEISEIS